MKNFDEVLGWYGMGAILLAYAGVSWGFFSGDNFWYQVLNLTGAFGVAYISYKKKAFQPAVLNGIWTVIALVGVCKIFW